MTRGRFKPSLDPIRALWSGGSQTGRSDEELLDRFREGRAPFAESAFEALVRRHGPMVRRVCHQILSDGHAAEDAFQSTFLVLVRKADSVRRPELLSRWLCGVAVRAARKTRLSQEQETKRARSVHLAALEEAPSNDKPLAEELMCREAIELLHEELGRLPDKYMTPVILCHLEGLTCEQATRRLRWPVGTVTVRPMRAREILRHRLSRRGLALTFGVFASLLSQPEAVPATVVEATMRSARSPSATAPAAVVSVTEAVLRSLGPDRLWAVASLLAAIVTGMVAGIAGPNWLSLEQDLDARALMLAHQVEKLNFPIPRPSPPPSRPVPVPDPDVVPTPSPGHQWVAFEDDLLWNAPARLLRYHSWSGPIPGRSGVAGAFHVHQDPSGDAIVTVSHTVGSESEHAGPCRPDAIDNQKRRFDLTLERTTRCIGELGDMAAVDCFRLSHKLLPFERINAVGVERTRADVLRRAVSAVPEPSSSAVERSRRSASASQLRASPGCSWVIGPLRVGGGDWTAAASGEQGGVICALSRTRQGLLNIDVVYPSRTRVHHVGGCDEEYRPVVFDKFGRRHVLIGTQPYAHESGVAASAAATTWSPVRPSPLFGDMMQLAPVDTHTNGLCDIGVLRLKLRLFESERLDGVFISPSDVEFVGIERVSPEALRNARVSTFMETVGRHENWFVDVERRLRHSADHMMDQPALDPQLRSDFEMLACFGACEVLVKKMGQERKSPETLRLDRIAQLISLVNFEDSHRGTAFENWVDPTLTHACEIAHEVQGGANRTN